MDPGSRLPLTIAIVCLFCAAYCAVTEAAFASVSKNKIKLAAERGDGRAEKALYALENFDEAISALLISTNIVHIVAAALVTLVVTNNFGLSWVTVSTLITTVVVFFFGEMLPKSIAKKFPERFTLSNAGTLVFLMRFFAPISALLTKIANFFANMTKGDPEISVTEDELYDIIEVMTEDGTLDEEEGDLISSAIEFDDKTVGSIMTPKGRIVALNINESSENLVAQIRDQNHSRLPVYDGDINNIIGILSIRSFIKAYLHNRNVSIRPLLKKPFFVQRSMNIDDLLNTMSGQKFTLAVVQDMHGKTVGLVSVEDILEELVGEIWDEDDNIGGIE